MSQNIKKELENSEVSICNLWGRRTLKRILCCAYFCKINKKKLKIVMPSRTHFLNGWKLEVQNKKEKKRNLGKKMDFASRGKRTNNHNLNQEKEVRQMNLSMCLG